MRNLFVVHYSEVALKGNNRSDFVKALKRNINKALHGIEHETKLVEGRIFVESNGDTDYVMKKLGSVFGVSWFAKIESVPQDYPAILDSVLNLAKAAKARTFKIVPRRADKSFPHTSQELAVSLGAEVAKATGMGVDLSEPDIAIHVDIIRRRGLVYANKLRGPGGLPVGTAGRVVHLFSGGIDSPVAAWLLMKRGSRPVFLHFYLAPTPMEVMESKIAKLQKVLAIFGGRSVLVACPFADYQLATLGVQADIEPMLFRRYMRMVAEELAPRFGATAISTGDSLSQAASQTTWNLATFDDGSSLPVLRPLLTYDKEEIVSLARRIGTYELSIEDYKDCCAMITRHPRTKLKADVVSEYVRRFGLRELAGKAIAKSVMVVYYPDRDAYRQSLLAEASPRVISG